MKKVAVHNLGCKVNGYELDMMVQALRAQGFVIVPFTEPADVYVVNTCTVTNIADRKSRQMLHKARQENPQAVVVAVGCYVETDKQRIMADPCVDLAIENNRKGQFASILTEYLAKREAEGAKCDVEEKAATEPDVGEQRHSASLSGQDESAPAQETVSDDRDYIRSSSLGTVGFASQASADTAHSRSGAQASADTAHSRSGSQASVNADPSRPAMQVSPGHPHPALLTAPGHTRAYIKIQDGCNQFCTYCIIPYARGRIRSRDTDEIVEEIKGLAAEGVKEVVLTGIHISSFGKDRGEQPEQALLTLLTRIQLIAGIHRIRLGSLEPRIMTEEFVSHIARLSKVCPHFHLSLQSGCDATLRRMNRHYTTTEYYQSVELLRHYYDRPAITTDVIVGFAGETPEEFAQSKAFLEKVNFYEIHVFKYSVRHGTAAAKMPQQQTPQTKATRSNILLELTRQQARQYRESFLGQEEEILLEEPVTIEGKRYWIGHTMRYVLGAIPEEELANYQSDTKSAKEFAEHPSDTISAKELVEHPSDPIFAKELVESPLDTKSAKEFAEHPSDTISTEELAEHPADTIPGNELADHSPGINRNVKPAVFNGGWEGRLVRGTFTRIIPGTPYLEMKE